MHMVLTNQGIPPKSWVTEALKCASADIKTKYMFEVMRPGSCVGNWELYDLNHPPLPDSVDYSVFATWLCLRNQSGTHTVRQIEDMLHTIRQDKMRVNEFNTLFNRLVEELHQQRCLTDDNYRSTFAQDNMVMFPPVRESRETRSLYLAGLNSEIGTELRRLSMQQGLQGFLANGPGVLTRLMNSDTPSAASSQWMVFTCNFKSGTHEPRLQQLQECALLIESTLKDLAFTRAREPPASQTTPERRMLMAPSAPRERSIFRTHRAPSPAPLRVHALDAQVDLVEEIDDEETDLERLYETMQEGKKVLWTRAQLKKLQSEDRCFKCAQKGHRSPECQNPPANPKTIRFTNLLEVTSYDTEDDALLFALHELNGIDGGAGNGTASQ
jgi:hypothetical protein